MAFGHRIHVERTLYEKLARAAETAGYASTEEFILHVLEKTVERMGDSATEEEIRTRLKGLGYIE
jgi:hypothetical protein